MNVVRSLLLAILTVACLSRCAVRTGAQTNSVAGAVSAFGFDLFATLNNGQPNVFISPYSISTCLAMAYAGARGETEQQMARVLHLPLDPRQVHAQFASLQQQLLEASKQSGIQFNIANALWTQKGFPFLPAFLNLARQEYGANINQADFRTQSAAVTAEINQWVARQTNERIKDIVPPGAVNPLTRLVLANAIYFKGTWATKFDQSATTQQAFHVTPARQVQVPLMHHLDTLRYFETESLQGVELPYAGRELSMLVLLPRQVDGYRQLQRDLTPANLKRFEEQTVLRKVDLFMPRFKLECTFQLERTLARMGMVEPFQSRADFSGIDGNRDLFISALFHKTWVDVNEQGTEAAGATVGIMHATAVQREPPPIVFRADHPFFFLIRDTRSGLVLFIGRLVEPAV